MTTTNDSSRRAFLAALAAGGAAATVLPGIAHADGEPVAGAAGSDPSSGTGSGPLRTEAFPPPTPGTNYTFLLGSEFQPNGSGATYDKGSGQISSTTGGIFFRALSEIPPGARITEVTYAVVKPAGSGSSNYFAFRMTSGAYAQLDVQSNAALPFQAAEQYIGLNVTADASWVVDNEQAAAHWVLVNLGPNSRVNSVRVGWTLARPQKFFPIEPKRVYDSRFVAPISPLATGANRVVSVANGYPPSSGTIDVPNVVPAGALAIAYNLTVANTVGSGFLSVSPGDATALGASSINWFPTSGLALANGLVVKLDNNRQIKVFCGGGGSADFIIDILGYYL